LRKPGWQPKLSFVKLMQTVGLIWGTWVTLTMIVVVVIIMIASVL